MKPETHLSALGSRASHSATPGRDSSVNLKLLRDAVMMSWVFAMMDWMIFFGGRCWFGLCRMREGTSAPRTCLLAAPRVSGLSHKL